MLLVRVFGLTAKPGCFWRPPARSDRWPASCPAFVRELVMTRSL